MLDPDQRYFEFVTSWANERGFDFVPEGYDGRESPELIDGMAADDVWGWLLPQGSKELNDECFGYLKWSNENGKLCLEWKDSEN